VTLAEQDRQERSGVQLQFATLGFEVLPWGKRDVEVDRTYLHEWFTGEPNPTSNQPPNA
jgi:hypothetical protein